MKNELKGAHAVLASRLTEVLLDAAVMGQSEFGRGVLWINCVPESLAWTYKPLPDCGEEIHEWTELDGLLTSYEPDKEVLIALFDGATEFFRLPIAGSEQ